MLQKKERKKYESELIERLAFLERNLNNNNKEEYSTVKRQLEEIYQEYATGVKLRSKARVIEENEKNLSFYIKEETRNYNL